MPDDVTAASTQAKPDGKVKEIVEQILVAFILAFIFRCFLVEAFVIPTGSMAPTLLGAHVDYRCPDCGYDYAVNYSSPSGNELMVESNVSVRTSTGAITPRTWKVACPNCGYRLPRENAADPKNQATGSPIKYGDRILVMKYQYLLNEPGRWDVVVFKADAEQSENKRAVGFDQNYIKRLVGLPGETLMVLDGDLFVSIGPKPVGELAPADFTVRPKSHAAQEAMWRIVYDNDHQPRQLSRTYTARGTQRSEIVDPQWTNPWTPLGKGWTVDRTRFRFDSPTGDGSLQFDPGVAPLKHALTDWLAYAQTSSASGTMVPDLFLTNQENFTLPVSDLKLKLVYQKDSGTGVLRLRMTKRDDAFIAEISDQGVTLLQEPREKTGPAVVLARRQDLTGVGAGSPARVEFVNSDYRVSITVDGKEVISTTPEQYKPDVTKLLEEYRTGVVWPLSDVSIDLNNQAATLSHVSLWRDVYYASRRNDPRFLIEGGPTPWASPERFPSDAMTGQLMRLGPDEYFVLGDNTRMSLDGRFWMSWIDFSETENLTANPGRVPERFLVGKAFFVYWPAAERASSMLPLGIIPDFASMRFIR